MSKPTRTAEDGESAAYVCPCGRVHHLQGVLHWERYILKCGAKVWALQPKRNGPLMLKALPPSDKPWTVTPAPTQPSFYE